MSKERSTTSPHDARRQSLHASHLFVPAHRPELAAKTARVRSSAIIIDLEDAVVPAQKAEARKRVKEMRQVIMSHYRPAIFLRVNNDAERLYADVEAAVAAGVDGVVLPKAETPDQVRELADLISYHEGVTGSPHGQTSIELLIESVDSLAYVAAMAQASPRVSAVVFGVEDFALDLGVDPNHPKADLGWAHALVLQGAARARVPAYGILGQFTQYRDLDAYKQSADASYAYGYVGSYCIHPAQVAILKNSFLPSEEQRADADRIVQVFEEARARGLGAVGHEGRMIDKPIYERAQHLLDRAQRYHQA